MNKEDRLKTIEKECVTMGLMYKDLWQRALDKRDEIDAINLSVDHPDIIEYYKRWKVADFFFREYNAYKFFLHKYFNQKI